MSFLNPYLTPGDKMKMIKPYCTSTRHARWDSRVSFLKSLKCRRSSSNKLFFRTDGRTERGKNNSAEISLESAGIRIKVIKTYSKNDNSSKLRRNEVENKFNPPLIKTRWKIDKKIQNDTIGYVFDVQFKLITIKKNKRLYFI